ncbi:MAG: FG-GAP-like repeat-containing protein [Pirellulaceae bacterium]
MTRRKLVTECLEDRRMLAPVDLLMDINPGPASSYPRDFVKIGDYLFFTAEQLNTGRELWRTDGTPDGTILLADAVPGSSSGDPREFSVVDGRLTYTVNLPTGTSRYVSDGTIAGTVPYVSVEGISDAVLFAVLGDVNVFQLQNSDGRVELWTYDNEMQNGTKLFEAEAADDVLSYVGVLNDKLYFHVTDGADTSELWATNGAIEHTYRIATLDVSGTATSLVELGDHVLFLYMDSSGNREIWKATTSTDEAVRLHVLDAATTDFSPATLGTSVVFVDRNKAGRTSIWTVNDVDTEATQLIEVRAGDEIERQEISRDWLYIFVDNGEVWQTNGTVDGTSLIHTITDVDNVLHGRIGERLYFFEGVQFDPGFVGRMETRLWISGDSGLQLTGAIYHGENAVEMQFVISDIFERSGELYWFVRIVATNGVEGAIHQETIWHLNPNTGEVESTGISAGNLFRVRKHFLEDGRIILFSRDAIIVTDGTLNGTESIPHSFCGIGYSASLSTAIPDGLLSYEICEGWPPSGQRFSLVTWDSNSISVVSSNIEVVSREGDRLIWTTIVSGENSYIISRNFPREDVPNSSEWVVADLRRGSVVSFTTGLPLTYSSLSAEVAVAGGLAAVTNIEGYFGVARGALLRSDGTSIGTYPLSDDAYPTRFAPTLDNQKIVFAGLDLRLTPKKVGTELWIINTLDVPPPAPFDINLDRVVDGRDVDALTYAAERGTVLEEFDFDGSHFVDFDDVDTYLELLGARAGDSNLDGFVDEFDFVDWQIYKYHENTTWSQGDWNFDGVTDVRDFNLWSENRDLPKPAAFMDKYTVNEDVALVVAEEFGLLANDTDPFGRSFSAQLVSHPRNGILNLAGDGSFRYLPDVDFAGQDFFTYQVIDSQRASDPVVVVIDVLSVNDMPKTTADQYEVDVIDELIVDVQHGVLANDVDDGDGLLRAELITTTSHGDLTLQTDGAFSYRPRDGFQGIDTFTYVAVDQEGAVSDVAHVKINVQLVAPSRPTNVQASDGMTFGHINLTWNASWLAETYGVWRNETNDAGSATQIADSIATTSFTDTTATAGKIYYYWVRAQNPVGSSGLSVRDTGYTRAEQFFTDSGQELMSGNHSVGLGDFDGDGDLDAFFTGGTGVGSSVWLNDGSGLFHDSGWRTGVTENQVFVAIGDVDGDNDLDAYVVSTTADRLYLNDGAGNFSDSGQALGTFVSNEVVLGDVDQDGDLDAVVAVFTETEANVLFMNDGLGGFTQSDQELGFGQTMGIALGDLDGDQDLDVMVANSGTPNQVFLNIGGGQFIDSMQRLGDFDTRHITLGDLDGDGDLDAFEVHTKESEAYNPSRVWLNDGTGSFSDAGQGIGDATTSQAALGDIDLDGDLDVLTANWFDEPNGLWLNDGRGGFINSGQVIGTATSSQVAFGDLDGDGDLDVVIANFSGATSKVWLNDALPPETLNTLSRRDIAAVDQRTVDSARVDPRAGVLKNASAVV